MGEKYVKQDALVEKIRVYMEKERMAPGGTGIVAGVSGGADSVCLLCVLSRLAERYDWKLAAVHVNHGIREEAGEDAAYVEELCGRLGVPFFLKEARVEELAKDWGMSTEEAGRRVRYEAFEEAAEAFGAQRIAVAHNRNDRAETLLFHLFRGTGLSGMASIRPVRDQIIRPLLCVSREEIEGWLRQEGIPWRTDKSNETDMYTRNKLRNRVLPYIKKEICPQAEEHLAREAELLMQTADFVARRTQEALARCLRPAQPETWQRPCAAQTAPEPSLETASHSPVRLDVSSFLREDPLLQTHMLLSVLKELSGGGKDIGLVHVQDVQALFTRQGGRRVTLPYGLEAARDFGEVVIGKAWKETPTAALEKGIDLMTLIGTEAGSRGEIRIPGVGILEYSLQIWEKSQVIEQKTYTKWFDYDRIESLELRTRRPGDYLTVNEKFQKKSLKEYLIQEKIPAPERARLPLLADGSHILWVAGHRISAAAKVTEATKRVLRIHIRGGKEDD